MNYAQRYNTGQLDAAFKNAASMYELFSGQTDYYIGINDHGKANNVAAWKSIQVDTRYGGYVIARSGFTNTLTRDEIKTALGFVASMDNIKQGFAPTNINTISDDPSSWDNPFARYYAEEAPTFTTYEPLAYYTSFPDGPAHNPNYSFYDTNIRNSVGQPGPWGTQAMVFENEADNNVFLFYDHFSYDTENGAILKGNAKLKLKEGRKYNWDLTSETANLGLQTSGFSHSWLNLATAEEQNKYAIDAIFSGKNLLSSGFSWYLTQKPNLSKTNFVYRSQASIIAYKDFSENSFINDGGSFVFVEIENPQELSGSTVDCLCRYLEGKRVSIDDLWITQYPKGSGSITPVNHYPSSFDGIASFENKFPDHIAYPKLTNRTKSKKTKEYGHSFPESPSLDLVTDVNGQGMPQQILVGSNGESATYYPNGHTGSASATKQDYDSSKQLKTQIGTGGAFTQKDSISLIYPDGSIGKTTENGVWNNTYDNFRYFTQANLPDVETGVSHRFKDPTGSGYKFTYPANHSSKFGESFFVFTSENFSNLEPLNFNKQILPSNKSENYTGPQLKNQYITKSSAASSHNHSEHYRSSEPKNNYPSAVDTLYHINTVNFKTGSFKVKKLDTGAFTSSDVFEFDGRISVTNDREYFSLPRGGEFLVIQPSTPFVSASGYRCPTFAHQISVEFDPNHYSRLPRHIRYFEESGLRFFINQARAEDPRKKKINWQTQKRAFNAYSLQTLDFFSDPILYAGHKHSAYPLDYEDVTLNLGTSDFGVPTLNVFGAAQINSEIVNYSPIKQSDYLNSGKYDNLYQETNSDWELDTRQVNTRGIALDPVLRWGVQDGRFEEQVALNYSNAASFGSQLVKNIENRGAKYSQFKAEYNQRILNLNNLPRVYGTPHSVKHLNVGNINSHPDICYQDLTIGSFYQNGKRIDLTQADGAIYNESSNINYRLEFSGFVKAYGEPPEDQIVVAHVRDYRDVYQDPRDDQNLPIFQGGSFNREYDETFYKYGDDGTLSIEISVRRRYKNRRPNIPNLLYRGLVAANYSAAAYDSILGDYASPRQNHFSEGIDDALKISTAGYPTRTPYEAYDINTYSPVPTERRDEQYNWHIENGALNTVQEKARRSL